MDYTPPEPLCLVPKLEERGTDGSVSVAEVEKRKSDAEIGIGIDDYSPVQTVWRGRLLPPERAETKKDIHASTPLTGIKEVECDESIPAIAANPEVEPIIFNDDEYREKLTDYNPGWSS